MGWPKLGSGRRASEASVIEGAVNIDRLILCERGRSLRLGNSTS
jgi:hypothetical protein